MLCASVRLQTVRRAGLLLVLLLQLYCIAALCRGT